MALGMLSDFAVEFPRPLPHQNASYEPSLISLLYQERSGWDPCERSGTPNLLVQLLKYTLNRSIECMFRCRSCPLCYTLEAHAGTSPIYQQWVGGSICKQISSSPSPCNVRGSGWLRAMTPCHGLCISFLGVRFQQRCGSRHRPLDSFA